MCYTSSIVLELTREDATLIDPRGILMIEPGQTTSAEPVIDELTRKMTAAWRQAQLGPAYRGIHRCMCGVTSDNCDHYVEGVGGEGLLTNSLCIHYLAYHRGDVPVEELAKVRDLTFGEEEPDDMELAAPKNRRF